MMKFSEWGGSVRYGPSIANKKPLLQSLTEWGFSPIPSGDRWKILCPFHHDQEPSLVIYPDDHWWCFGCSTGGDVIDFAEKHLDLTFLEALAVCATLEDAAVPRELIESGNRDELNTLSIIAYWARQAGGDADGFIARFRTLYRQGRLEEAQSLAENLRQGVDSVPL